MNERERETIRKLARDSERCVYVCVTERHRKIDQINDSLLLKL